MTDLLPEPTTAQLEAALKETLDALMAYRAEREQRPRSGAARLVSQTADQLMATPEQVLDQRDWCSRPVDRALKEAMHAIGQHLATRLGSTKALGHVADRLAGDENDRGWEERIGVLDKAFDGIEASGDTWMA